MDGWMDRSTEVVFFFLSFSFGRFPQKSTVRTRKDEKGREEERKRKRKEGSKMEKKPS